MPRHDQTAAASGAGNVAQTARLRRMWRCTRMWRVGDVSGAAAAESAPQCSGQARLRLAVAEFSAEIASTVIRRRSLRAIVLSAINQ